MNDQQFSALRGDVLLDVARSNGISIPHDCRSGRCGACRVRVVDGLAIGGECQEPGVVRACQTRVMSDLQLAVDAPSEPEIVAGWVRAIARRALDIVELKIEPSQPIRYRPGQYLRVQFRGYPVRCYSPTVSMENGTDSELLHFQLRRYRRGQVSSAIGSGIREGCHVKIVGPFGSAFLRPDSGGRLVLVASDTGFAPVWSIAVAALHAHPRRQVVAVVGARSLESLYMIKALCSLARYPNVAIIPVVETPQKASPAIRIGGVDDHVPRLSAEDLVHVCGPLQLVQAVRLMAGAAGASCYSVPFVPQDAGPPVMEDMVTSESSRRIASTRTLLAPELR